MTHRIYRHPTLESRPPAGLAPVPEALAEPALSSLAAGVDTLERDANAHGAMPSKLAEALSSGAVLSEGSKLVRATKAFAQDQRARSWWNLAATLAVVVAAIAVICMPIAWPFRVAASIILSLIHVRFFVIYHDYMHGAILGGSKFAEVLFQIYGLLTLAPASIWRHSHDHHHRNNSRRFGTDSVGSYPVMSIEDYRRADFRSRLFYRIARNPVTILLGYLTVFLWGFCILPLLSKPREHLDAVASMLVHGGVFALLAILRPDLLVLGLLVPSFIASALGSYLFYAQHNFPGVKLRPGAEWDYVDAALHSSSLIKMSPVMHWFTGNIGYHHVHHLNARIPFYRLPEAMASFEELQSPGTTTLWPWDIFRCLRLKLWDYGQNRMVGYGAARSSS